MKSNRFTLVLAVLFAIVAGGSVYAFTASVDQRSVQSKQPVTVLVAALPIPTGITLGEAQNQGMITEEVFPASTVPSDALKAIDADDQNLVATAPIERGALLRAANFDTHLSASDSIALPKGFVAVSVELKEQARVGSFVLAGSKIALYDHFISGKATKTTRVLVPSVLVLGVGTSTSATAAAAGNANLITVALTPSDAVRVIHAQNTGALYAALVGDVEPTSSQVATDSNLFGGKE